MKKRLLTLFLTVALACSMIGTVRADVMNGISVDGTYFEVGGGSESGDGWRWDAAGRTLHLEEFYSSELSFENCGSVKLVLAGENQLFSSARKGLWVENTTLTIEGDGKLTAPFMAVNEGKVTMNSGTLYFTGSDNANSNGAGIYGFLSDFTFSGGTVFAGGKKYGMRLGFGSNLAMTGDSFMELYGPEAALTRMEVYTLAGSAVYSEAQALAGLPTDTQILGGNEANDRKALSFSAVGEERDGQIGYVAALTTGRISVNDVFADEPVISGAARRAYLDGNGVNTVTETLPAPSELTWGKVYDPETVKLASCPVGLGWKVYGDTDGMFHIFIHNGQGESYGLEYVDISNDLLGVKDGRYYLTADLALELFLSVPRGERYTIEVTNVSTESGVGNSDPAASTAISDDVVTAWLAEMGYDREEEVVYDEEDTTIPKQWRAYERSMELLLDDYYVPLTAYALKDPTTGYETNYVRVRDIAFWLNDTTAAFDVSWDGAVNLLPGQNYNMNGTELITPFWGTQQYQFSTAATKVNGTVKQMQAILLKDAHGNGYTYYKLRDLGAALGFHVDWSAEKGVYIETK